MDVLVIESNISLASQFLRSIRQWGHEAEHARTGNEAVKMLKLQGYDVVIINTALSDSEASEVIPRIKKIKPKSEIIAITQRSSARMEKRMRKLGIIYYMTSVVPGEELKDILDHIA
jgi:DNA-binding response OmpR family regulator